MKGVIISNNPLPRSGVRQTLVIIGKPEVELLERLELNGFDVEVWTEEEWKAKQTSSNLFWFEEGNYFEMPPISYQTIGASINGDKSKQCHCQNNKGPRDRYGKPR